MQMLASGGGEAVTDRLVRDCWPVEVFAPELDPVPFLARVFVSEHHLWVWREGPTRTPLLVVDIEHAETIQRDRGSLFGQLRFATLAGPVHVTKTTGCGCSSPLKALSPPVAW
jgi:hypothetical protein